MAGRMMSEEWEVKAEGVFEVEAEVDFFFS